MKTSTSKSAAKAASTPETVQSQTPVAPAPQTPAAPGEKVQPQNPATPVAVQVPQPKPAKRAEPSFTTYAGLYSDDPSEFVKSGKGIMQRIAKAKDESDEAKAQLKTLGLQFAVLGREFFTRLMTTPAWFNKTVGDFIRHTYGLKDEERFPAVAWTNARLVLAIVVPDNGAPLLSEKDYLALSQSALGTVSRIALHETVMLKTGQVDRNNPNLLEACQVASSRADGFMKALRAILARVEGKAETPEQKEEATLTAALETVRNAILKAGDGDETKARSLYLAYLALADCWDKSGVKIDQLEVWTSEHMAAQKPARTETPATPAEPVPQLAAAA